MSTVKDEETLNAIEAASDYLRSMHLGSRTERPDVDDSIITAAMTEWIKDRNETLANIKAGFQELRRASDSGEPVFGIRVDLSLQIESYNGCFFPRLMESYDTATGSTPIEGWLFKQPPREWRMIRKTQLDMNPVDYDCLFFDSKSPSSVILDLVKLVSSLYKKHQSK
jgi:hypothetical protein